MQSPRSNTVKPAWWQLSPRQYTGIFLVAAALLRLPGLFGEMQYDELWSSAMFSDKSIFRILIDIELPNNHPVNSLILKMLSAISAEPCFLRLGVYIAGTISVLLCGKIAYLATGKRSAEIAALFLASTTPALILYSSVARGYIFQILGLQLCILGMFANVRDAGTRRVLTAIIGGGILCCLSISSGIMFLAVVAAGYLILAPKEYRFNRNILISAGVLLILALGYYLPLYPKLQSAQRWGTVISSVGEWFCFAFSILRSQLPYFTALPVLAGVIFIPAMRKVFLLTLLPLIFALLTKAGQERVYLVLTPAYIIIAAAGFGELSQRFEKWIKLLSLMLIAGCAVNYIAVPDVWKLPTPSTDLKGALRDTDETVLPILPASEGMPIVINSPKLREELEIRAFKGLSGLLIINTPEGKLNGADFSDSEKVIDFPLKGVISQKPAGRIYLLYPAYDPATIKDWALLVLAGDPPEALINYPGEKIRLNIWLNKRYKLFVCRASDKPLPYIANTVYYHILEGK